MLKQIRDKTTEVETRHAAARECHRIQAVIDQTSIETLEDLKHLVIDFSQNQYKRAMLQDPEAADLPEPMVWGVAKELLERKYTDGLRGALRAARLGVDGGIRGLVEHVYEYLKDEHIKAYRRFILENEVATVDWDGKVSLAREFLRSASSVIPKKNQISPDEMAGRVYEAVEKHIQRTSFLAGRRPAGGA